MSESNVKCPTEPQPERQATDRELVDFLVRHIDNPCEVQVEPGVVRNIRDFYLGLAKEQLEKMKDVEAKRVLEEKIKEYETNNP